MVFGRRCRTSASLECWNGLRRRCSSYGKRTSSSTGLTATAPCGGVARTYRSRKEARGPMTFPKIEFNLQRFAGDDAAIVRDVNGDPAPQYYNPVSGQYEYVEGSDGASKVTLTGSVVELYKYEGT